jgi:hypothetical protein
MSNMKKDWKTLYQTDSEWLRCRKDGSEPTLEIAEEIGTYEDDEGSERTKFQLFEFPVERFKLVPDPEDPRVTYLVGERYESSWPHPLKDYEEWFADDLAEVAGSAGRDPLELAKAFTSPDPKVRAGAYMDVAGHHGVVNFDNYPREINEPELDERWD